MRSTPVAIGSRYSVACRSSLRFAKDVCGRRGLLHIPFWPAHLGRCCSLYLLDFGGSEGRLHGDQSWGLWRRSSWSSHLHQARRSWLRLLVLLLFFAGQAADGCVSFAGLSLSPWLFYTW